MRLIPTPEELDAFLSDAASRAEERVVDRLLASPRFGEHWARHWLDLVGYAETRGHEFDHVLPNAWQYRDWLIRAFNDDLPYDQLVREHVAGDLIVPPRLDPATGANESILGTIFWWLGEEVHSPVSTRADQCDRLAGRVDVLSRSLLGMTVACARCHDHKFDAISQRDFYALAGFQASSIYRQARFETMETERAIAADVAALEEEGRAALAPLLARELARDFQRAEDGLLAGRELVLARANAAAEADALLASIAEGHELAPSVVLAWAAEIERAQAARDHPLAIWAATACADDLDSGEEWTTRLERSLAATRDAPLPDGSSVLLDLASGLEAGSWIEDGFAFGGRVRRAGELLFSNDPSQPIARIQEWSAARYEPAWNVLDLAPGTERDPGALAYARSGRTWISPTFRLAGKKLFLLVRGAGHCYAAVDGHKLLDGPLHARTHVTWEGVEEPRWIEQDLAAYGGHRAHLELTPREGYAGEFALLRVVESDSPPDAPSAFSFLADELAEPAPRDVHELAKQYGPCFTVAIESFATFHRDFDPRVAGSRPSPLERLAPLLEWMRAHPELGGRDARPEIALAAGAHAGRRAALLASIPRQSRTAPVMLDGSGVDEPLLLRGNPTTPGEEVPRRLIEALAGPEPAPIERGSGRLELARELTDPARPLLARVFVNRVWHHLLGRGIVPTVDDFGSMGEPPTDADLLDHLARRFVADGWSIKRLVRAIVLSSTYRMDGIPDPRAAELDPKNELWHHVPPRRTSAEEVRDAILAVSGRLDTTMYGTPIPPHLTEFMEGRGRPVESGPLDGAGRRTIYLGVRRNFLSPLLLVFDFPSPATTMGRRSVSNVPAQALTLMNDPFVAGEAARWAERTLAGEAADDADRVASLWRAAFAREPEEAELAGARGFLLQRASATGCASDDPRVWAALCHVLLNAKEFVYLR